MTKQMTARYEGTCSLCHEAIHAGHAIVWNSEAHSSRHADCPSATSPTTTPRISDSDSRSSHYWTARYDDERYH